MRPKDLDEETGFSDPTTAKSGSRPVQELCYADGSKMNGETSGTWAFWFDARGQKSGALQLRRAYEIRSKGRCWTEENSDDGADRAEKLTGVDARSRPVSNLLECIQLPWASDSVQG